MHVMLQIKLKSKVYKVYLQRKFKVLCSNLLTDFRLSLRSTGEIC